MIGRRVFTFVVHYMWEWINMSTLHSQMGIMGRPPYVGVDLNTAEFEFIVMEPYVTHRSWA